MLYWFLKKIVIGPILKLIFRPWVDGEENFPRTGPAIFASNHLSFSDSFFLPVMCPRRITFPAKMEYFTGRGIKGRLTAWFFKGIGQIPIDRSGGAASEAAIESGLRVLRRGELFGIYPEGTRSPDGRLYKGKTGIARMALEAGCPVIPVAMVNTDKAQPTGQKVPNIVRIGMRIGKPLDFRRYEGLENDRFVLRSITDEIMYELMLLSGQEYVDVYATSIKKNVLQTAVDRARQIAPVKRVTSPTADAEIDDDPGLDVADVGASRPPAGVAPSGEGIQRRAS
ncbi:MAG: lysophospholipid acyltransferase family protein [Dermatophilaceae bacterium]